MANKKKKQINSLPQTIRTVTFRTLHGQKVYKRNYKVYSRAVYNIGVMLRVIGKEEEAVEMETLIDKEISKISESMRGEKARLQSIIDDVAIESMVKYTDPVEEDVIISTPRGKQYLNLIISLEDLVSLVDTLWLEGELDDAQQVALNRQWRQSLMKMGRRVIHMNNEIRKRIDNEKHADNHDLIEKEMDEEEKQADAEIKSGT